MLIDEILARSTASYRDCGSYSDTGHVLRVLHGQIPAFFEVAFRTAFVRGTGICFEAREQVRLASVTAHVSMSTRVAVWGEEHALQSWTSKSGRVKRGRISADAALAALHGRPSRVISLLCPGGTCDTVVDVGENPVHIADEQRDERTCLHTLSISRHGRTLAWIDRETYLLRGVREEATAASGLRIETDVRWVPLLDTVIPPSDLHFEPPK